jgi:NADH-quinone oxidoreductase subunit N
MTPGLQSVSGTTLGPLLVVAVMAVVVLVTDVMLPATEGSRHRREQVSIGLVFLGLVAALTWSAVLAAGGARATLCSAAGCYYVADGLTCYLQILVLAAVAVVVLLARSTLRDERLPPGEFGFLLLISVTGMLLLPAARDLITLLVALEVVSLPAFVLVGLRRSDARSGEAALTYFVFSVIATAITIYGIALMYGVTGGLTFGQVSHGLTVLASTPGSHRAPLAAAATIMITVGFTFKIAAVPFHAWAPDTYQGAPLPVAAALSTASKAAGFAGLIVLLFAALGPEAHVWGPVIAAIAVASMTVGNVAALRQTDAVRLLAWSTVAQAGYLLVPLSVAATAAGRNRADLHEAIRATLAYLGIYVAANLGAFSAIAAATRGHSRRSLADLRGLARRSPLTAVAVALFFTALAGLPPGVAGLIGKVVVLQAAVDGHLTWLAVIAAVNTVIGLAYYLRVAALPFLGLDSRDEPETQEAVTPLRTPAGVAAALGVAGLLVVALSIDPQPLLRAAGAAAPGQPATVVVRSAR